jgi:transposase
MMKDHQPVVQRPARTAADRRAILEEYDSYPRGDARRGALLRRHGVYTSQIAKWRQRLARGETTLDKQLPGPKPRPRNPLQDEVTQLRHHNACLQAQLAQAQAIIDVQKKVASLLSLTFPTSNEPL